MLRCATKQGGFEIINNQQCYENSIYIKTILPPPITSPCTEGVIKNNTGKSNISYGRKVNGSKQKHCALFKYNVRTSGYNTYTVIQETIYVVGLYIRKKTNDVSPANMKILFCNV